MTLPPEISKINIFLKTRQEYKPELLPGFQKCWYLLVVVHFRFVSLIIGSPLALTLG